MGLFSRKKGKPSHVIDLREPEALKPEPLKPRWGSPMPCPECSGRGYLDHIDPYREIMFIHCTECYAKYEVARADLDADAATNASTI